MTLLTNTAEGQADGTTVTTGNSGGSSGSAFDAVNIVTGGVVAFKSAVAAHGARSYGVSTGTTTSSGSYVLWSTSLGTVTTHYGRAYIYMPTAPATTDAFIGGYLSGTSGWGIQLTTAQTLAIQNSAFATVATMATVMALNTWYRIEYELINSATVGQIIVKIFVGDSQTPVETYTSAATQNFGASTNQVRIGWNNGHVSQPLTYFDEPALSTTGFLGIPTGSASVAGRKPSVAATAIIASTKNNAEGGTNGTTVSAANSGGASGVAFTATSIGTGATLTYDNTHVAHGALSYKNVMGTTSTNCYFYWDSLFGAAVPKIYFRQYLYLTANNTSGQLRVINVRSGATVRATIGLSTTGHVTLNDSSNTVILTSTTVVPLNQWFRLEGYVLGDPSVGQIECKIFTTSPDGATPDETLTTTAAQNTGGTITRILFGNPSSATSYTFWMDELAASVAGYMGPSTAVVTSAIKLKKMVVAGSSTEKSLVTSAIKLKKMVVAGTGSHTSGSDFVTSAIKLKKMVLSGVSHEKSVVTGTIKLKKMVVAGSSTEKSLVTAVIKLKKMVVAGVSHEKSLTTAVIKLKKMVVSGASSEKSLATGTIKLKKMVIAGSSTEKSLATAVIKLKKMVIAGSSTEKSLATAVIKLKKMVVAGSSTEKSLATSTIKLKKMVVAGSSTEKSLVTAAIHLKKMVVSGSAARKSLVTSGIKLKKMIIAASSTEKSLITSTIKLKKMIVVSSSTEKSQVTSAIKLKKMVIASSSTEKSLVTSAIKLKKMVVIAASLFILKNNFEGVSSGTTLTAVNSGGTSGNAFDAVSIPAAGVLAADNTHAAHGTVSLKVATTTTAGVVTAQWKLASLVTTKTLLYFRVNCFITASATPAWRPFAYRTSANGHIFSPLISGNSLQMGYGTGFTGLTAFTSPIPINTWFRIEGYVDTVAGTIHGEYYSTVDAGTPTEQHTYTGLTIPGPIDHIDVGNQNSATSDGPFWMDDIAFSHNTALGPVETFVTSSIKLKKMIIGASSTEKSLVTATIKLKKMIVGASSTEKSLATSAIKLKKMVVSGVSHEKSIMASGIRLKKMTVSIETNKYVTATGAIHLKKMTLSGTGYEKSTASGSINLKKMTLSGTSYEKSVASGSINLKKMTISSYGSEVLFVSGSIELHKMQLQGHVNTGVYALPPSTLFIFAPI